MASDQAIADGASVSHDPVRARRHDLALLWTAVSVAGAISIKLFHPPEPNTWVRMMPPVGLMLVYVFVALRWPHTNRQRTADSVYFLGFLWTLWALICALLWESRSVDRLTADALFRAFGYALITTASGMFGRLLILQFFRTVDDQETEAIATADDAVGRTLQALNRLEVGIATSHATLAQGFQEWWNARREETQKAIEDQIAAHREAIAQSASGLNQALSGLEPTLKSLVRSVAATAEEMDSHKAQVKSLTTATQRLSSRVDATCGPCQRF